MQRTRYIAVIVLYSLSWVMGNSYAQTASDGPVRVISRVKDVRVNYTTLSDSSLDFGPFTPPTTQIDEYKFKFWVRDRGDVDGLDWLGGNCLQADIHPPGTTPIFNDTILDTVYNSLVPDEFGIRMQAWEDDIPTDFSGYPGLTPCHAGSVCTRDTNYCCYFFGLCLIPEEDDRHCFEDSLPGSLDIRAGPPCAWTDHGYISGTCGPTSPYEPSFETWWQYVNGDDFPDAIDLGVFSFSPISHFNSSSCYSNQYPFGGGKDVMYKFSITEPQGIQVTLCGGTSFDSRLFLLDSGKGGISSNNDFCGFASQVSAELCTPGDYFIVVDGRTALDEGNFILSLSFDPDELPRADAGPDREICIGESILLGGFPSSSSGSTIEWSPAAGLDFPTANNPIARPDTTTTYVLKVTSLSGCIVYDSVTITVFDPAKPDLNYAEPVLSTGYAPYWQWFFDSGLVPGANDSFIIVLDTGLYHVLVTDSNGCITSSDTLFLVPNSKDKILELYGLVIYPNPSSGSFRVEWGPGNIGKGLIEILDIRGKRIATREIGHASVGLIDIHPDDWPPGVYWIEVRFGDKRGRGKLILMD